MRAGPIRGSLRRTCPQRHRARGLSCALIVALLPIRALADPHDITFCEQWTDAGWHWEYCHYGEVAGDATATGPHGERWHCRAILLGPYIYNPEMSALSPADTECTGSPPWDIRP
jgi:hypothetical protein